jgi:uncharacterized membrane protein YbhN (UPF0104 family)
LEKIKLKKISINLLKLGFSVAAICWVISKISFQELVKVFSTSNAFYLGLAVIFLILSFIFSAYRQNLSFKITGAHITQMLNLKLFWLGMFYNLFLPGGVGGDGYKVFLVNKYRKNGIRKNIGAMLVNRISGLVAIGVITVILYYLAGIKIPFGDFSWILIPLVYAFYLIVMRYFFRGFFKIHAGLFWWSMILQSMQLISAFFILKAFHQSTDMADYLFLFFVSAIATALPITIGGFGARELVFLFGAKYLSLNNELAVSLSVMFFILSAFLSLGGMYWVFFPPFRRESEPIDINNIETENLSL